MMRQSLFVSVVRLVFWVVLLMPAGSVWGQSVSTIDGDFDRNCRVDIFDFYHLTQYWLSSGCGDPNWCEGVDIDHSTRVDGLDYSLFADRWLRVAALQMDQTVVEPLGTLNITVSNIQSTCTIKVEMPTGVIQSFSPAAENGTCVTTYNPSYLNGTYQIWAVVDGCETEAHSFSVPALETEDIAIQTFQANDVSYYPERDLTFTVDLVDPNSNPLTGFSAEITDKRYDTDNGRLSILRKIQNVAEDGTITARILLYFDTTSSNWSGIYANTTVKMSLYYKDYGALPADIILVNGLQEGSGYLTNEVVEESGVDKFNTTVVTSFNGADRISYLDIIIPPGRSLSDVVFSVDYIKYYYNTGWNDRIYIGEKYVDTTGNGYERTTGSKFSTLGRFPIFLPLTPNENGLIYYAIHADETIGETHLNKGAISENDGTYINIWRWGDYIDTTARVYVYADKWGYSHDFTSMIQLEIDPGCNQTGLSVDNFAADSATYFPDENINFSFDLKDGLSNPVSGFTGKIADSVPNSDSGAMYILRKILNVATDGSATARLYLYFDTTGSYSNIYSGTTITMTLYDKDGITPLNGSIGLTTGFINNDPNDLSSTLVGNMWQVNVDKNFGGNDRIAYLDFDIPGGFSVSDVVFSVDYIKYNYNTGYADSINIAGVSVGQSSFPRNYTGGFEFVTGSRFGSLGRLPLKLSLNPSPGGFVFYRLDSADIEENNINYGILSEAGGAYQNDFKWNDYIVTTAKVHPYVDSYWYNRSAVASAVDLSFEGMARELALYDYDIDSRAYTLSDTRHLTASVIDGYSNPISGFTMKDPVYDLDRGKLSIVTQDVSTTPDPNNVVRLLLYFDTTGRWSGIYANTEIDITVFGSDGKTGVPGEILIREGSVNAEDFFVTTLTENAGVYSWNIRVDKNFSGADRQVYLDFICSDEISSSNVVFAINYIKYRCDTGWADAISIRNQTVHQGSFPRDYTGQFEFNTGNKFGNLGRFPLYLTLNPGGGVIFPMMQSTEDVEHTGSMSETNGDYTYSHYFATAGLDYNTALKIGKFGYFDNEYRSTDSIMLYFSGEPRYLGGLDTQPVMLESTWQVDLDEYFFVEVDYNNVEYFSSDPGVVITDNSATFSPTSTDDTAYDVIITARSTVDPLKEAVSDPFTLYAATCMTAYDCADDDPNIVNDCVLFQCESFAPRSSYSLSNQGVDLRVLNKDLTIDDAFCDPNQVVRLGAVVSNTGTTNIFDVAVNFYLDDTHTTPIGSHTFDILSTTYMDLPFFAEQVNLDWRVPGDLSGAHRIWVEVSGTYPLGMEEDMLSNNYATLDFFVNEPNELMSSQFSACSVAAEGSPAGAPIEARDNEICFDLNMLIPVTVQVCEDEIVCGPVTGYELSYWSTLYWPSWSGYCQEFGVAQEVITGFIRTYETIMTLGMSPSLADVPGALKAPLGWGDGWLPCHPEPTLFAGVKYAGVTDPGCGGLCPVSAWDCGEGYSFQPRFDSKWYNDYAYNVAGGARKITRCYTENDYINVPYQLCFPGDPFDPNQPFSLPFSPFAGGPGGINGGYGGSGPSGPGSGPGGGPPIKFTLHSPTGSGGGTLNYKGIAVNFNCTFGSTGAEISHSTTDTIYCVPDTGVSSETVSVFSAPATMAAVDYQLVEPVTTTVDLGMPAPDFTLSTIDGAQITLSSFRGQSAVLVFGTTQCPHCRSRIPFLNQLHADGAHKVLFVAVNATESSAKQYIADNGIDFEVLIDTNARIAHQYRVSKVPEIFIIDTDGDTKYNSPELGQLVWFYLADELEKGAGETDIDVKPTTLSDWAAYGLYDTMPNPQAIIMDLNRDQKVDLFDVQMLSMSWLMEDYSGVMSSGCTVAPLK